MDPNPFAVSQGTRLVRCAILNWMINASATAPEVGVSCLPLSHDMGVIGCLLSAVSYPAPLVLIPPENFLARPALWLRAISRHRGTASAAPSFGNSLCAHRIKDAELDGVDLSSWRIALNGAEPVSMKVMRTFARRFQAWGFNPRVLTPGYGLAEPTLAVTYCVPERPAPALSIDSLEGVRTGCVVALGFTPEGADVEELLILAERGPRGASVNLEERIRKAVLDGTGVRAHTVKILDPGTLPRTSSGKMRRREALRRFLSDELSAPQPVNVLRLAGKRSEEHTSELQSPDHLVCRLLLEKKKKIRT